MSFTFSLTQCTFCHVVCALWNVSKDIFGCVEESTHSRANTTQCRQNVLFAEPITFQRAFAPHLLPWQHDNESVGISFVTGRPGNAAGYQACHLLATSEPLTVVDLTYTYSLHSWNVHFRIRRNAPESFEKSASFTAESTLIWHVSEMTWPFVISVMQHMFIPLITHVNQCWYVETSSLFLCHIFIWQSILWQFHKPHMYHRHYLTLLNF